MKKLLYNLVLFSIFFLFIAESTIRVFHFSTDAGRTYKNANGNVNYYPMQEGYWNGGKHKWFINGLGYPGKNIPSSFDNLILLIGDSYIQNFMNPDSCRQKSFLDQLRPEYNYLEVSMGGLNFLGYLEYSKPLDTLKPIHKLIYVGPKDFQSVILKGKATGGHQIDIQNNRILYPKYRGSRFKDFVYNFKFLYYLYRKNLDWFQSDSKKQAIDPKASKGINRHEIDQIIDFAVSKYDMDNITLIFHPNVNIELVEYIGNLGISVFQLRKRKNDNWSTMEDGHWSCYGHRTVAAQVSSLLRERTFLKE